MCEHYIAHGLCTDFPDWSIAAAGSEDSIKIGYDYGRFVTGEEQDSDFDLSEEGMDADGSQVVPDPLEEKTMVATSAEVFVSDYSNVIIVGFFVYNFLFCVASGTRGAWD